jgi:hypothetical protein
MWNYYAVWKVLEELLGDLKERNVEIPTDFLTKLKAAHGNINILKADHTYEDTMQKVEEQLNNLEGQLVYLAENRVGPEYADKWIARIKDARESEPQVSRARPFSPGVPRADYWIRLTIGEVIRDGEIRKMASDLGLSIKEEDADTVIVHGEEAKVKSLVKKMTAKMREERDRA